jgi:hypothetical protein
VKVALARPSTHHLAHETEPGVIAIADTAVTGVHLTRLRSDGSGKAEFEDPDENAKIMVGHSAGSPIVLAPPNDLLGQVITEGIEDGLSAHEITGFGVGSRRMKTPDANEIARTHGKDALRAAIDTGWTKTNGSAAPPNDENAPRLVLTLPEFLSKFEAPDYLVDGLLQRHFLYSLTGMTGAGKTARKPARCADAVPRAALEIQARNE